MLEGTWRGTCTFDVQSYNPPTFCGNRIATVVQLLTTGTSTHVLLQGILPRGDGCFGNWGTAPWPNHFTPAVEVINSALQVPLVCGAGILGIFCTVSS